MRFWRLSSRWIMPLLLLFLGALGARAILLDEHPDFSESILPDSAQLYHTLAHPDGSFASFLKSTAYRPPGGYLHTLLIYGLLGGPDLTLCRLGVLMQYLLILWLVFDIGRVLANRQAGVLAMVLVGTLPHIAGWSRMSYMDTGLSLAVMLAVRVLVSLDLRRRLHGVWLGLALGLGLLTKVAFPIFIAGPILWILIFKVRQLRHLAVLGIAALFAALVCGWWYVLQWEMILINMNMTSPHSIAGHRLLDLHYPLLIYFRTVNGGAWLLVLALGGGVAAWCWRTIPREKLLLLWACVWPPLGLLMFMIAHARYALPAYTAAGLCAGICLQTVLSRFGRKMTTLAVGALTTFLLGLFVAYNLGLSAYTPPEVPLERAIGPRFYGPGLLSPDRRDFDQYKEALLAAPEGTRPCLVVVGGSFTFQMHWAIDLKLKIPFPVVAFHDPARYPRQDEPHVCVIAASDPTGNDQWQGRIIDEDKEQAACLAYTWFLQSTKGPPLRTWRPSPLGIQYTLYQLDARALQRPISRSPRCKFRQVGWDRDLSQMRR